MEILAKNILVKNTFIKIIKGYIIIDDDNQYR